MDERRPFPGTAEDRGNREQEQRYWRLGDYDPEQYEDEYGRTRVRGYEGGRYPGAYGEGSAFGGGATPVGAGTYGDGGPYRSGDPASTRRGELKRWRERAPFGEGYGRERREPYDLFDRDYDGRFGTYRTGEGGSHAEGRGQRYAGLGPKGYRRSDDRIREDVCEQLTMAGDVDAREIEVSVRDCEVYLTGTVADRFQKRAAEDVVEDVPGVRDVHNQLRVGMAAESGTAASPAL